MTRATAKFPPINLANQRPPILTFTSCFATSNTTVAFGTVAVSSDKIISISSVHPSDLKANADGTASPFKGHVLSSIVYEGAIPNFTEESLVLGDPAVLTSTWAHLTARMSIRLTTTEQ